MQNVGTWDSDFAIFFFFIMMLPMFIGGIVNMMHSFSPQEYTDNASDVSPNVIGSDNLNADNVISFEITDISAPKSKSKKKHVKKKKSTKKKPKVDIKTKAMIQESVTALNKIGVQKSRANSIIRDLCKEKTYSSSEDLVKDAIVYV